MSDISTLSDDLNADAVTTRRAAAERLAQLGERASAAAIPLVRAAGDEDETTREWAVAALEGLGRPALEDLDALLDLISDSRADVGYWAVTLTGRLGPAASAAVTRLASVLGSHPQPQVRQRAAWALGKIGPAASAARPALEQASRSEDPRLARLAAQALAELG